MIDKDVTADNIYFGNFTENGSQGNAVIVINKGVTLTAKEGIYAAGGSNILHSGILKGTFKATDGYMPNIFSKGGVIEDSAVGLSLIHIWEKASGSYGRVKPEQGAVKIIDPRKE